MGFPCGNCNKDCKLNCIACDQCNLWFHIKCQHLSKQQLNFLTNSSCSFFCLDCNKTDGNYNFNKSMTRLGSYSNDGKLEEGAKVEQIFLRQENNDPLSNRTGVKVHSASGLACHDVSARILGKFNISVPGSIPVAVHCDGDCLFHSVSVGVTGHEGYSTEIRVRTCLELVLNRHCYDMDDPSHRFWLVCVSYDEACSDAATRGAYSSGWALRAAATVVGVPIKSIYPPMNGILDNTVDILSTTISPVGTRSKSDPIIVMWTHTQFDFVKTWTPNHFVPIVRNVTRSPPVIDLDSDDEFPPLKPKPQLNSTAIDVSRNPCPTLFDATVEVFGVSVSDVSVQSDEETFEGHLSVQPSSDVSVQPGEETFEGQSIDGHVTVQSNDDDVSSQVSNDSQVASDVPHNRLNGKFLTTDTLIDILTTDTATLSEVPGKLKEDTYFLIDNTNNINRKKQSKRMEFYDNCGTWDTKSTSTKTSYFVKTENGNMISCVKKKMCIAVKFANNFNL